MLVLVVDGGGGKGQAASQPAWLHRL